MSNWQSYISGFKAYLRLERSLSQNSIDAYERDVEKLTQYLEFTGIAGGPGTITLHQLQDFLKWISGLGVGSRTQARLISGLRAFYKYLLIENIVAADPTELLELPKIGMKQIGRAHV